MVAIHVGGDGLNAMRRHQNARIAAPEAKNAIFHDKFPIYLVNQAQTNHHHHPLLIPPQLSV